MNKFYKTSYPKTSSINQILKNKKEIKQYLKKNTRDIGEELADVLFVTLCLANQTGVDLQSAFDKKMKVKTERDFDRHQNNEKLKNE